jgi:diadenylate cyclase
MSQIFKDLTFFNFLDWFLVAILIYQIYKIIKGTVAIRIFAGIIGVYFFWKVVEFLEMELLTEILGQFIGVGVIALIIVFQQEIRRFLLLIGTTGFMKNQGVAKRLMNWAWKTENEIQIDIPAITTACSNMAETKTGALIVISRSSNLQMTSNTGDEIDAVLSNRLLENIFYKNSPLHDGAVIIHKNRVKAARCVLPSTENKDFPASLGMRHRAAVGITENTDAIAISVSEQTGGVSVAIDGQLHLKLSDTRLRELLLKELN